MLFQETNQVFDVVIPVTETCPICGNSFTVPATDENCLVCGSRPRVRALSEALKIAERFSAQDVIGRNLLAFSMSSQEWQLLSTYHKNYTSVTLYGKYYRPCIDNVDARDLSRYADNKFSAHYSCLLFDYLIEHEAALSEAYRVLKPGGYFLTHIAPDRLRDAGTAPVVHSLIPDRISGYLKYVPDTAVIPSIHVGIQWFSSAMRNAGFTASQIHVQDPIAAEKHTWFLGIKPVYSIRDTIQYEKKWFGRMLSTVRTKIEGKVKKKASIQTYVTTLNPAADEYKGKSRTLLHGVFQIGAKEISLRFEYVTLVDGSTLKLLEVGENLVGRTDKVLLSSSDHGYTWSKICGNTESVNEIHASFTLSDGSMCFAYSGKLPNCMLHIAPDGRVLHQNRFGWYGSQCIGESRSGVVMFGEYPDSQQLAAIPASTVPLGIWRMKPRQSSSSWEKVLACNAGINPSTGGDIRHFHICAPTGLHPRQWLVSSGDTAAQSRVWLSNDDGDSWQEMPIVTPVFSDGISLPSNNWPSLARFTAFSATQAGNLVWGTDDSLGPKSQAVFVSFSSQSATYSVLHKLGGNPVRNIIKLASDIFLTVSQSSANVDTVDFTIIDIEQNEIIKFSLPNVKKRIHSITSSMSSRICKDGFLFLPSTGSLLTDKFGIFRIIYTIN
jgi:SAM-dependent methyltransferase